MRQTGLLAFVSFVLLTVNVECQSSTDQVYTKKLVSRDVYERVLDTVFPRDEKSTNYRLVLRFEPTSHKDSQIVITSADDGSIRVIEYTSSIGSIYTKLCELVSGGAEEDPIKLASHIRVEKRLIRVPALRAKRWFAGFLDGVAGLSSEFAAQTIQLNRDHQMSIVVDGTYYRCWFDQAGSFSFSMWDYEVGDKIPNGRLKLIRWMNLVRLDIGKR